MYLCDRRWVFLPARLSLKPPRRPCLQELSQSHMPVLRELLAEASSTWEHRLSDLPIQELYIGGGLSHFISQSQGVSFFPCLFFLPPTVYKLSFILLKEAVTLFKGFLYFVKNILFGELAILRERRCFQSQQLSPERKCKFMEKESGCCVLKYTI